MDDDSTAPPPAATPAAPAEPPAEIAQILLAKQVLAEGARLLAQGTRVGLGLAVSLGQDSAELMLRAAFKQWGLQSGKKPSEIMFHDLLRAVDEACRARSGQALPRMHKLGELNTARVNFKHYGLALDADDARRLFGYAGDFFDAACREVFGIDPATVSMADLIADPTLRWHLKAAQALLAAGDANEALTECAWAERLMRQGFNRVLPALGQLIRLDGPDRLERQVGLNFDMLLQFTHHIRGVSVCAFYGIDPEDWRAFQRLIPKLHVSPAGTSQVDHRMVVAPDKLPKAAAFCVDFAIDMALVIQERSGSPRLRAAGL